MTVAYVLGQIGERHIGTTGWIGADPTGRDVAFLLIYPTGDDIRLRMRTLAGLYGLVPSQSAAMPAVPADIAYASVDGEPVVRVHPGDMVLHRPVTREWADIALSRGEIVLTVGERRFAPDQRRPLHAIDRYIDRSEMHAGLLRAEPASPATT